MRIVYKYPMNLRSLRYFAEVAATENFSRAAARLHRSQPAISRGIQELEAELGLKLFQRDGRRVALTPQGRALLEQIRPLLLQVEAVQEHARLLAAGKTRILRIGAVANLIERVLAEILRRYREKWPQVEVVLQPEGGAAVLAAIERGEIDLALARYTQSPALESQLAFPFHVLAVLARRHRLASAKSVSIRDIAAERLLIGPQSINSRRLFDAACQESGVRPRIALESVEFNALVALAEAGEGIAVVPSMVNTARHAVSAVPIVHKGTTIGAWTAFVWDRRREQPDYVRDFVREACSHLKSRYPGKDLKLPPPALHVDHVGGDTL